jgi:zinc protease
MLSLAFTPKSLEVQRSVVIEEFKQRYLNQPYGDVWLELRPEVYKVHPYKWATIGKEIKHIEEATMEDVKGFFKKFYHPANAILCIGGNLELDEVKRLATKWFGDIPAGETNQRNLPQEPKQTEYREKTIERAVPTDAFYYAFRMEDRLHPDYFVYDTLSDILGRDKSSRLFKSLKKEQGLVSNISAYVTGSVDSGMLVVSGKLNDGITFEQLDEAFWKELEKLTSSKVSEEELSRIMIKIRTSHEFQHQAVLNRAMALCMNELLGDAEMINHESEKYAAITPEDLQRVAASTFIKTNCTLLKVKASHAE